MTVIERYLAEFFLKAKQENDKIAELPYSKRIRLIRQCILAVFAYLKMCGYVRLY
ncbi:hypothetical protein N836_15890 [Leptolyngbya sp. Heron Island J]|nr:hypothetical protein N836_15890 [Leptolyngbya sp. Heron Island J]